MTKRDFLKTAGLGLIAAPGVLSALPASTPAPAPFGAGLPVEGEWDVAIAGGGPSGIAAAISAARQGAKVLLIERYGVLGGMLTLGHVAPLLGSTAKNPFIDDEMIGVLRGAEQAPPGRTRNGREIYFDNDAAKARLHEVVAQSGAEVFLQTPVVGVTKDGSRLAGIVVATPRGLALVKAKVFIDSTGDGNLSFFAGAPFEMGRPSDGRWQPATIEFCLENVDEAVGLFAAGGSDPVTLPNGKPYREVRAEAHARGELPKNVTVVNLHAAARKGERIVNATQANGYDPLNPREIGAAMLELQRQIPQVVAFLRNRIPGYESCRVKTSASTLGARETRRVMGDYVLADADVELGARFDDAIVHEAWFLIDIHNPAGGGQAEGRARTPKAYDIPYRCLLPRGVEGLLTAGRCISGTHRAHASYRVMCIAMAIGQAAGIAAALSVRENVTPRELAPARVRQTLASLGVLL